MITLEKRIIRLMNYLIVKYQIEDVDGFTCLHHRGIAKMLKDKLMWQLPAPIGDTGYTAKEVLRILDEIGISKKQYSRAFGGNQTTIMRLANQ